MEPVAGTVLSLLIFAYTGWANYIALSTPSSIPLYTAAILHITSWIAQFIGHGIFEKRAPALLDNLFQALVLGPIFVWLEVLFFFGYRPDLKQRTDSMIEKEIARFHKERAIKTSTNGNEKKKL
jgi:uncharacterized membrane protein YGL010W